MEGEPDLLTLYQIKIKDSSPLSLFAHHTYDPQNGDNDNDKARMALRNKVEKDRN